MNSFLVLCFAAICTSTFAASIGMEPDENSLIPSISDDSRTPKDFLKITKAPPARVTQPSGSTIELECEAVGSPVPVLHWVHGSGHHLNDFDTMEENILSESDPTVMTTVRARIIIENSLSTERTYTCVAKSGFKTAYTSTVVFRGPRHPIKSKENANDVLFSHLRPIRITDYIKSILTLSGSNLVLPCKTSGRPGGEVTWFDPNDNAITGQEPRYKVVSTGELLISDLKWTDMGHFTCVAKNGISKDTISTFIYPLRPED